MYAKAIITLLLLSLLSAGLWKLYDAGGDAREDRIVREWHEERQALLARVEPQIQKDRIVYRDRIQKIREVVNDCIIPDSILRLHHDSGIYSGEVRSTDLQRANP